MITLLIKLIKGIFLLFFGLIKTVFKLVLLAVALVILINAIVIATTAGDLETDYTYETVSEISESLDGKVDCIIVLGAAVYSDGTPGELLKDRLDRAIELYNAGVADKLLLSGDNGQVEYNEVEVMKNYVINAGVDPDDVFLDHAGFSTYESIYRAQAIFGVESAVIVTQTYHEYRALYIAERFGIEVYGVSAADVEYANERYRQVREVFARVKDFVYCIFKPDPTYLGNSISLSGSGTVTW